MFYKYKITFYDDYADKEVEDVGLVWADTYGDAANRVVSDYGNDNTIDINLHEIMVDGDTCINEDEINYNFNKTPQEGDAE